MPLNYDEDSKLAILQVECEDEGLLNDVTVLVEKGMQMKNYQEGIIVKIAATLKLDFIENRLIVTF